MENNPLYISLALQAGFDVEVDTWYIDNGFYLGHDEPQYKVSSDFLSKEKIWCHAKNLEAALKLGSMGAHYFWHQTDDITLTSKNYMWTFPGIRLTENSICVMPETSEYTTEELVGSAGICSDYIDRFTYLKDSQE